MIRALWTAASGMEAQQLNIDVIANNLANVNTAGFKRSRADFQELLYKTLQTPGNSSSATSENPTGAQIGLGVKPVAVQKLFSQGDYQQTENQLDVAIEGDGFFQILQPNGEIAYTRSGSFKKDREGQFVTSDGYPMEPSISISEDALSVTIGSDGTVSTVEAGSDTSNVVGQIELAKFLNPAGLKSIGRNLYVPTTASGDVVTGIPGQTGFGTLNQGYIEMSNVNVVEEMVNMIIAQRAYETNSKAIAAADEMLKQANNITR